MTYQKAALGGTFDRLHLGHQQLLLTALHSAKQVVVGVTQPHLNQDKAYSALIEDYSIRSQNVTHWLKRRQESGQTTAVVELLDVYGPTLTDSEIDVLVVTPHTRSGGNLINTHRQERQLPPLPIIEVPLVKDESGDYISSTRIRSGQISRTGQVYSNLFNQNIVFTGSALQTLHEPQGKIIQTNELSLDFLKPFTEIVLVGDSVTQTFIDNHWPFTYAVIDGQTKRQQTIVSASAAKLPVSNSPGTINAAAVSVLLQNIDLAAHHQIFEIQGEEDLLAFLPVLTLPLQSVVFYGQPNLGIGMITVDEAAKSHYAAMIKRNL